MNRRDFLRLVSATAITGPLAAVKGLTQLEGPVGGVGVDRGLEGSAAAQIKAFLRGDQWPQDLRRRMTGVVFSRNRFYRELV